MASHKLDEARELNKTYKMFLGLRLKRILQISVSHGHQNDLQLYNKSARGSLHSSQPSEAEIIS